MGVEPNAWSRALPVLCAYVPICSGTGSVTPAFCAAKKSIFNFQPQSRAAPRISPAAPSGITRRRVREAASYNGDRSLRGGGGKPPPYREPPLKERAATWGRPYGPHLPRFARHLPKERLAGGQRPPQQRRKNSLGRAGEDTRPTGFRKPVCLCVGAGPRPARGRTLCASTGETEPGMLVRRRQAQKWDRAGSNFLPAQAPSGAGRNRAQALLILRAGNVLLTSRGNPRNRGPGKGEYERVSAHPEPSPVAFCPIPRYSPPGRGGAREQTQFSPLGGNGVEWTLRRRAAMGKVGRRPQAAKSPCGHPSKSSVVQFAS